MPPLHNPLQPSIYPSLWLGTLHMVYAIIGDNSRACQAKVIVFSSAAEARAMPQGYQQFLTLGRGTATSA